VFIRDIKSLEVDAQANHNISGTPHMTTLLIGTGSFLYTRILNY